MSSHPWDRPQEHDHLVVVAEADAQRGAAMRDRLEAVPGRGRAAALGSYPRFRCVLAADRDEALRLVAPEVSALAVDLALPRDGGLELVREVRRRRGDVAILALGDGPASSDPLAVELAGADHYLDQGTAEALESALELALDRRRLARLVERAESEAAEARARLARIGGGRALLPGFHPPATQEAVLPWSAAARLYLVHCARIFDGDPRGLAERLGMSYFALRRLLKRYEVPFPGRSRGRASSKR